MAHQQNTKSYDLVFCVIFPEYNFLIWVIYVTRFIFVRHGQSPGNLEAKFYGHTDKGLTDLGKKQAELTAKFLKDYKIDAAYSSDLGRAFETGLEIAKLHKNLKVIPEKGLREVNSGKWENLEFAKIGEMYAEDYKVWMNDLWNARPTGGESVKQMCKRVTETIWRIAKENDGKTVLITTHATPIRVLNCEWSNVPYENLNKVPWVKNASVSVVDYDVDNSKTNIVVLGDASFHGEFATELPTNI